MRGGYTMVELLLSLALTILMLALAAPAVHLQTENWERMEGLREESRALASALALLSRDLQQAGYRTGSPPLLSLRGEEVVYSLTRVDGSRGAISGRDRRRITVWRRRGDLMYRVQAWDAEAGSWRRGSTRTLASGIASILFEAVDGSGEPVPEPGEAAALRVTLTGRRRGSLTTVTALRNGGGGG